MSVGGEGRQSALLLLSTITLLVCPLRIKLCVLQMENRIENLLEAGILDPAKVTRHGLQNACGIAGILLTTQAIIVEKPDKSKPKQAQPGGYGPDGMPAGMTM